MRCVMATIMPPKCQARSIGSLGSAVLADRLEFFQLLNAGLKLVIHDAYPNPVEKEREFRRVRCRNLALSCLAIKPGKLKPHLFDSRQPQHSGARG